ncbi:hypothetical protein M8C21_006637 [Ambrosia artemisiifolia]|uniref:CTP synthase n=1 Tax=Ambrosia artemisiifolia TaxID=4212 RepID=A0AAD5BMD2_AMBAR|nr:hypothetical protein M8C21_006637 [Ambrosia artemisiifolia]
MAVMLVTTCLTSLVIILCLHKPPMLALCFLLSFGSIDLLYFSASLVKFREGCINEDWVLRTASEHTNYHITFMVQVVPHITDAIQDWIERVAAIPVDGKEGPPDVCVIELGITIGDIESMSFIEAIGQFSYRVCAGNVCLIHVSLVSVLHVVGEQELDTNVKEKLSRFCHVPEENIVNLYDVSSIWHIPLLLREQKAHEEILKVLELPWCILIASNPVLGEWTARAQIRIAMVGKYIGLSDSYLYVLKSADGVLVTGGFGDRGVEGKIIAAKYARENNIPYLGICLGMQTAVIEYARSVLGLKDANSTKFDQDTKNPCVIFMPEVSKTHMGGTMRVGLTYGNQRFIAERHRHRYDVWLFSRVKEL